MLPGATSTTVQGVAASAVGHLEIDDDSQPLLKKEGVDSVRPARVAGDALPSPVAATTNSSLSSYLVRRCGGGILGKDAVSMVFMCCLCFHHAPSTWHDMNQEIPCCGDV